MSVYAVVYHSYKPKGGRNANGTRFVKAWQALPNAMYDGGDDPAFWSADTHKGPVTWGVCRPNLRRPINVGDTVAFFARRSANGGWNYYYKGFATVACKVSQTDIWTNPNLKLFRGYVNLLIKLPKGKSQTFKWFEPVDCHDDWLWRICRPSRGQTKKVVVTASVVNRVRSGRIPVAAGAPVTIGDNYVVFSTNPNVTRISKNGVPVATSGPFSEKKLEVWRSDETSQRIKRLVLGNASTVRGLKSTNQQDPHPHLHLDRVNDAAKWRREMAQVT